MALICCKECKAKISSNVKSCPHCGASVPRTAKGVGCFGLLIICIIVVGSMIAIYAIMPAQQGQTSSPTAPASVKPAQPASSVQQGHKYAPSESNWNEYLANWKNQLLSSKYKPTEPDWNEHRAYWKSQYRSTFEPPEVGQSIKIILKNGIIQRGKLISITNESVTIEFGQGTITYNRKDLKLDCRCYLYEDEYIPPKAMEKVQQEQDVYLACIREFKEDAKLAKTIRKEQNRNEKIASLFSAWDGSLKALKNIVKPSMNDPNSFEHVKTTYTDNGTYLTVYMAFRGKNALNAIVVNEITAKVDLEGNVVAILEQKP